MTNNFDSEKEFLDNKNFSNNNNYQNSDDVNLKNDYLNTNINMDNLALIKSCKQTSIAYIVLWSILFVFVIFGTPFAFNPFNQPLFFSLIAIGTIFGLILFVWDIALINQTLILKRSYYNHVRTGLFVWFWVGLYLLGIFSFIGSFLAINNCNKIKNLNLNQQEIINKSEYSNTSVKNKQNNLSLLKVYSWASFLYIFIWLSLIIFIIVVAATITTTPPEVPGHDYYNSLFINTMGIGCGCFGFILFSLSIFLASVNISFNDYFYPEVISSYNLFIIGSFFCGITSFFGSILTIYHCNRIKKQYFNKSRVEQTVSNNFKKDKKMKKSLKISFAVFGLVVAIVGAGLIGGTYGSYSNYQLLSSMENTINNDKQLLDLKWKMNANNESYFNNLLNQYSFGSYVDDSGQTYNINGLTYFFNDLDYNTTWNQWLDGGNGNQGIINYLSSLINQSSLSSNDVNLLNQTIENLNNFQNDIFNGFPNSSDILNILENNIDSVNNDNSITQRLINDLNPYKGSSGLLTTVSAIDSSLTQLINNKVIDLSDTSSMNSTTKQYFENYISLLGTNSATLMGVNPSSFVAMFYTNQATSVFNNSSAIGLNNLVSYSSQTYFETTFTLYQFAANSSNTAYIGFSMGQISPDGWNKNIENLSDFQKTNLNNILQSQKNAFYQAYPTWDGTWKNVANSANLSDDEAYDIYYLQDSIYHLNCNYNADQSGVIAGSVLLSIGLLALVVSAIFLGMIRKKEKKEIK